MKNTRNLTLPPAGAHRLGDEYGLTNFDHSIRLGTAEALKADPLAIAHYAAWEFSGYVWWDGEAFRCGIYRYGSHVETLRGDSLEDIMRQACEVHGHD